MTRLQATRKSLDADPQHYLQIGQAGVVDFGNVFDHPLDSFSWIMKLRLVSLGKTCTLVRKYSGSDPGYQFYITQVGATNTAMLYAATMASGGTRGVNSTVRFNDAGWHHVALTVDRAGYLTIWVDGVGVGNLNILPYATDNLSNTASFKLGATSAGTSTCEICQVGHYNRALSQAEVEAIAGGALITDGLTGYFPCDEAADTSQIIAARVYNSVAGAAPASGAATTCLFKRDKQTRVPEGDVRLLRLGMCADLHHGILLPDRTTYLTEALGKFVAEGCHAVVHVGDSLDLGAAEASATAFGQITAITDTFSFYPRGSVVANPTRFAIGSHDADGDWAMTDFIAAAQVAGLIPDDAQGDLGYWYEDVAGDVAGSKVRLIFLHANSVEATSNLSSGINASVTVIPVNNASVFAIVDKPRTVAIGAEVTRTDPNGRELITYTGTSGNNLTGCTRGAFGTTAVSHSNAAVVYPDGSWVFQKVSKTELDWLESVLAGNTLPVIVFLHYRADMDYPGYSKDATYANGWWMDLTSPGAAITAYNADEIRSVLEKHPQVKLVVNGHEHGNHWRQLNGINYLDIAKLGGGWYFVLDFFKNGEFRAIGYGPAPPYESNVAYTRR